MQSCALAVVENEPSRAERRAKLRVTFPKRCGNTRRKGVAVRALGFRCAARPPRCCLCPTACPAHIGIRQFAQHLRLHRGRRCLCSQRLPHARELARIVPNVRQHHLEREVIAPIRSRALQPKFARDLEQSEEATLQEGGVIVHSEQVACFCLDILCGVLDPIWVQEIKVAHETSDARSAPLEFSFARRFNALAQSVMVFVATSVAVLFNERSPSFHFRCERRVNHAALTTFKSPRLRVDFIVSCSQLHVIASIPVFPLCFAQTK